MFECIVKIAYLFNKFIILLYFIINCHQLREICIEIKLYN